MAKQRHFYPWFPSNWRASETRMRLTLAEQAIYRNWLDHCYCNEEAPGSLPGDEMQMLAQIGTCTLAQAKKVWAIVAPKFLRSEDGRWYSTKAVEVIAKAEAVAVKRAEAGAKGGASTWGGKPPNGRASGKTSGAQTNLAASTKRSDAGVAQQQMAGESDSKTDSKTIAIAIANGMANATANPIANALANGGGLLNHPNPNPNPEHKPSPPTPSPGVAGGDDGAAESGPKTGPVLVVDACLDGDGAEDGGSGNVIGLRLAELEAEALERWPKRAAVEAGIGHVAGFVGSTVDPMGALLTVRKGFLAWVASAEESPLSEDELTRWPRFDRWCELRLWRDAPRPRRKLARETGLTDDFAERVLAINGQNARVC